MLFFLRKLTEALLLPLGFCSLLIILAVVVRRRRIAATSVAVLVVFSLPVAGSLGLWPLEHFYPALRISDAPPADAIVMLAGGVIRGIAPPGVQWGNDANRFFTASNLAKAGKAKLFVISAGFNPRDGRILRAEAVRNGILPDRIVVTPQVLTTEDEARAVSKLPGIHTILLVTSAYHMPRAVLLFRAAGIEVHPFPTDLRASSPFRLGPLAFIPDSSALENSAAAVREYYGLLAYRTILFFRGVHLSATQQSYIVR
jgi:uncharacterized SAM-binding protein YcdF (DUF218 family)